MSKAKPQTDYQLFWLAFDEAGAAFRRQSARVEAMEAAIKAAEDLVYTHCFGGGGVKHSSKEMRMRHGPTLGQQMVMMRDALQVLEVAEPKDPHE